MINTKNKLIYIGIVLVLAGGIYLLVSNNQNELEAPILTASPAPTIIQPTRSALVNTQSKLVNLVNQERAKAKLNTVSELDYMSAGATQRAVFLFESGQWSHEGYESAIRKVLRTNLNTHVGENLARYFPSEEEVVKAWINSPSHKEVMLNPDWKYSGIGFHNGYWVLWLSERP